MMAYAALVHGKIEIDTVYEFAILSNYHRLSFNSDDCDQGGFSLLNDCRFEIETEIDRTPRGRNPQGLARGDHILKGKRMRAKSDMSWYRKGTSRDYVTTQTVSWNLMWKGSPYVLEIPPGREFESSVPRILQWLWSPDDPYFLKAALIHDVLLEHGARGFEADSQWRAVALSEKAPAIRTGFAYFGMLVRRFGQWIFKNASI